MSNKMAVACLLALVYTITERMIKVKHYKIPKQSGDKWLSYIIMFTSANGHVAAILMPTLVSIHGKNSIF